MYIAASAYHQTLEFNLIPETTHVLLLHGRISVIFLRFSLVIEPYLPDIHCQSNDFGRKYRSVRPLWKTIFIGTHDITGDRYTRLLFIFLQTGQTVKDLF